MPITQEYLKSLLSYDPDTGVFTWLVSRNRNHAGSIAGNVGTSGYLTVMIDRKRHNLHRLAFLYMEGFHPPEIMDHINGIKTDNRWINLRSASYVENAKNLAISSNNRSGLAGVTAYKDGKWRAFGYINRKQIGLGKHDSIFEAAAARKAFEFRLGYQERHGRPVKTSAA